MAGYACWYNLHQLFTAGKKQWTVLLHTGVTTRRDLLTRFLQQSVNHFAPEITAGWHFVMHWSTQASEETREQVWLAQQRQYELIFRRQSLVYGTDLPPSARA